jgi:hypothetical protein
MAGLTFQLPRRTWTWDGKWEWETRVLGTEMGKRKRKGIRVFRFGVALLAWALGCSDICDQTFGIQSISIFMIA